MGGKHWGGDRRAGGGSEMVEREWTDGETVNDRGRKERDGVGK